jgi:hypothetical protein
MVLEHGLVHLKLSRGRGDYRAKNRNGSGYLLIYALLMIQYQAFI